MEIGDTALRLLFVVLTGCHSLLYTKICPKKRKNENVAAEFAAQPQDLALCVAAHILRYSYEYWCP